MPQPNRALRRRMKKVEPTPQDTPSAVQALPDQPMPLLPLFPPTLELIRLAEAVLEDARAGRIVSAVIAYVEVSGQTNSRSALPPGDITALHRLNSSLSTAFHGFQRAMIGPVGQPPQPQQG